MFQFFMPTFPQLLAWMEYNVMESYLTTRSVMVIRFKANQWLWLNFFTMMNGLLFAWDKGANSKLLCNIIPQYGQNINVFKQFGTANIQFFCSSKNVILHKLDLAWIKVSMTFNTNKTHTVQKGYEAII